jgi:hypothetical protein
MAARALQRYAPAQAVADKVRSRDLEVVQQCSYVVGEIFVAAAAEVVFVV